MLVVSRTCPERSVRSLCGIGLATATAALALAGCSASITRFDNPSFAIGEGGASTTPRRTAGGPLANSAPALPPAAPGNGRVEMAGLPAIETQTAPAAPAAPPAKAMAVTRQPAPVPAQPAPSGVAKGAQIEVQQGDTLYGIGKRHKVLISDLMAVNELKNPNLKPGQKLFLPSGAAVRATPQIKPERTAAVAPVKPAPVSDAPAPSPPAVTAAPQAATTADTYTVKPGDSLYAIAAKHKIKVADLQRANGITDAGKVKPGTVLKLPSGKSPAVAPAAVEGETVQPETRIVRIAAPSSPAAQGVKVLNGGEAAEPSAEAPPAAKAVEATPAAASAQTGKLRWPAKGRIVQGFGPRADGSHNDGVDIAVPAGADVLAAENGVVAYAGNEVKTYGNLVLVRHDNGWVTAYAYNEKLLVQRGDRVKRGQPIAKAGKTGTADQPQVHFEVRVGSKPVDPTGYLEKL